MFDCFTRNLLSMPHFRFLCVVVLLGYAYADTKRCFCKAVDSDNSANVLHDFGSIDEHSSWIFVSCSRLSGCSDKCEQWVKNWVCAEKPECLAKTGGKQVRSSYQASVCSQGVGNNVERCGCKEDIWKCWRECPVNVFFVECYKKCISG